MFEKINAYATRCLPFEAKDLDYFNSLLQYKKQPRKTFLLQEGEVCQFEAYILKGCIRTYHIDQSGAEVTLQFAVEDWWVSDITSFRNRRPAMFTLKRWKTVSCFY
jgi:CRP-like cAMP-binding protein